MENPDTRVILRDNDPDEDEDVTDLFDRLLANNPICGVCLYLKSEHGPVEIGYKADHLFVETT